MKKVLVLFSLLVATTAIAGVPPEDAARQFAKDLNLPVQGVTCAQADSDGDGYVTCTVALDRTTNDGDKLISLQCAAPGGMGTDSQGCAVATSGCKMTPKK